jgi:predicted DNA-binding transcriptional regulator YafY
MVRSTKADKALHLNAAYRLLERKEELSEAARSLAREFDLSLRQAYRYLEEASRLERPVEMTEPTVPITLKLPPSTVRALRAYAKSSGLTLGVIVTRALDAFLQALKRHG